MSEIKQDKKPVSSVGVSSSGNRYYTPIEYVYDEKVKCHVPTLGKKMDRYAMIQACRPTCDINFIYNRAKAGDYSVLNMHVPTYADVSEVPDNLNDLHQMNVEAINGFYKLDPAIRKLFNNDVDYFIDSMNNGKVNDIIKAGLTPVDEGKEKVKEEGVE